jgi:hypothetical protein
VSEVANYIVKKPVLWFEAIGKTAPDAPLGFPEQASVVYRSSLALPGERFHLIDGNLVHEAHDGRLSPGALRVGSGTTNVLDAVRLVMSGAFGPEAATKIAKVTVPTMPEVVYPAHHVGIERNAVSPAYVAMMDNTEELRHDCFEEGEWAIMCSDYGVKRTVTFSVADAETGLPRLNIEHDPATDTAEITVVHSNENALIIGALASEGISMEGRGSIRICGWSAGHWAAVQSALSAALFDHRAASPIAMTMAMAI